MDSTSKEPCSSSSTSSKTTEDGDSQKTTNDGAKKSSDNQYECNICLDNATDAVISLCGHLFCWPCIHEWLETRPDNATCPVCKSAISKDKLVPLYGRGGNQSDPREKPVPPRPSGQRTEPRTNNIFGRGNGNGAGGFQFSFGVGAFPFTFFGSSFNIGNHGQGNANPEDGRNGELSNLFIWLGVLFMFWMIFPW